MAASLLAGRGSWGSRPGSRGPGRSCSGSTPISAAAADGRWAPARPPPPAAQWARSLGRTMRRGPRTCSLQPGRGALAGPVRRRPRRVSLGRARPTAAARPAGLRGETGRPASHCSRPRAGDVGRACSTPLRAASFPGPNSARRRQPPRRRACAPPALPVPLRPRPASVFPALWAFRVHCLPGPGPRRPARTCLPLAQRLLQPVGPHILRVLRPAAVLPRRCHRSRARRRRGGRPGRAAAGRGRVRARPSVRWAGSAAPGGPRSLSAPRASPAPPPPAPAPALLRPARAASASPRRPGGRGHKASADVAAAAAEARAPRPAPRASRPPRTPVSPSAVAQPS